MAILKKKSKEQKIGGMDKIKEYLAKYSTVLVVENTNIQNTCLKDLRACVEGKVLFAKKSVLEKDYPKLKYSKDIFLIFLNEDFRAVEEFQYLAYAEPGDISGMDFVIPAGPIRNVKLVPYLNPIEKSGANSTLLEDFTVVKKGEEVGEKASVILKIKGIRTVKKNLNIIDRHKSGDLIK